MIQQMDYSVSSFSSSSVDLGAQSCLLCRAWSRLAATTPSLKGETKHLISREENEADLLSSPVVKLADIETTTLGAAYAAALAAGVLMREQVFAGLHKENTIFRPKLDEAHKKTRADSWYKAISRSFDLADLSL